MRNEGVVNISYSESRSAESAAGTVLTCRCLKHVIALDILRTIEQKRRSLRDDCPAPVVYYREAGIITTRF